MKRPGNLFNRLSIHYRLLFSYSLTFLIALTVGILMLYSMVRTTLEQNIENELKNSTNTILGMVKTAIDASIQNHLRGIAETNHNIVQYFYNQSQKGLISQEQAKQMATRILLTQTIGQNGYIYCIDHNGIIQVHPETKLIGTDLSENSFIQTQKVKKEGYMEYNWANPGEKTQRSKALYMSYFKPWDWIISVSSYRGEFNALLRVEDFRENILSLTFGKTGYPYIMNSKGLLIVHPKLQGTNIYESIDDNGRMFIKEICEKKNGKIIYPWKNPDERIARKKLVIFNYIPELDWIIASSSYLNEFYSPLTTIGYSAALTIFIMLILIIPITWLISSRLAKPLQEMINVFESGVKADFSNQPDVQWGGAMNQVAENYNRFIDKLQKTGQELQNSEERFRSIFENSVEGIFQISPQGECIAANPAMATMLGYDTPDNLVEKLTDMKTQLFKDPSKMREIVENLKERDALKGYQIQFIRKDTHTIWVSLNAKAYKSKSNKILYIEGFLSDITEQKKSEQALKLSYEKLENRVEERTRELSNWVKELEQRDARSALLRDMSEMIQVCHTADEIFQVLHQYIIKFFPDSSGQLFIFNHELNHLKPLMCWGDLTDTHPIFNDDCWALRRDKPYLMDKSHSHLPCSHMEDSKINLSICIPMISQGDILGMFHLRFYNQKSPLPTNLQPASAQRIATRIAQHIALALVNINLRESLKLQSIQDPLTGLYNRRFLNDSMTREFSRMARHRYSIGMIMIDVDHFKHFNDNHGHECGDAVLQGLGHFLKKNTRAEDIVCRYGGEEFAIMLIDTTLDSAIQKAQTICDGVREGLEVRYKTTSFKITISLGVAVCPLHAPKLEECLTMADQALYQAKTAGRDQVIEFRAATT
ncbi:MAG: diguanylate cyclase [Desulfobacteraceae bacterium]|nr:diguanylate cyclase [Desulfobacteraceae bacterium]